MSDRYHIKEKIGQGGLGEVFVAVDTQLQREVALKRMKAAEGQSQDDLLKEAKVLSALQHPNILTVFDVGQDTSGPFVITELLRGETLERVVERGAVTYEDFRQLAVQALEGLIAAHALDLVHRDLKPGNLMVIWHASGKFQIKILDFGLAKFSQTASKQTEDQEEGIMGSIFFMAPEQFERLPLDPRTDLYALGCIFYFALTCRHPFDGETAPAVMAAHLTHRVTPLAQIRPDLPPWLCNWVMWFINRQADHRPGSAKEALDSFQQQANAWETAQQAAPLAAAMAVPGRPGTTRVNIGGRTITRRVPTQSEALWAERRTGPMKKKSSAAPIYILVSVITAGGLYALWMVNEGRKREQANQKGDDGGIPTSLNIPSAIPGTSGASDPSEKQESPAPPPINVRGLPIGAGTTKLPLSEAHIFGKGVQFRNSVRALGHWQDTFTRVVWDVTIVEPGTYEVVIEQSVDDPKQGGEYLLTFARKNFRQTVKDTKSKDDFERVVVGTVDVRDSMVTTLEIKAEKVEGKSLMNLGSVVVEKKK